MKVKGQSLRSWMQILLFSSNILILPLLMQVTNPGVNTVQLGQAGNDVVTSPARTQTVKKNYNNREVASHLGIAQIAVGVIALVINVSSKYAYHFLVEYSYCEQVW